MCVVTIAVAIAVAFWMTGIIGFFTGAVKRIKSVSLYAQPTVTGWTLMTILRKRARLILTKGKTIGTTTLSPGVSVEV
jgi:ABC-type molybdate transport system permease subunit